MYVIFTSRFYVLNVHRTTYKRLNSYLLIEKSILQFEPLTPREKVSSLCISPIISFKNTVTLIIIINHWPLTILVSQLLPLQTLRYVVFCQIFHLLRVQALPDTILLQRLQRFYIHQIYLFYSSESYKSMTSSPNFQKIKK